MRDGRLHCVIEQTRRLVAAEVFAVCRPILVAVVCVIASLGIAAGAGVLGRPHDAAEEAGSPIANPRVLIAAARPQPDDPPERRDLHGDPLPPDALTRLGTVRYRPGAAFVRSIVFTPDGKQLVTHNSWRGSVSVWDAGSGKELCRHAPGGDDGVGAALLTADGRSVVTVEHSRMGQYVCIRDRQTLKEVRRFVVGNMHLPCLTPAGKRLIAFNTGNKEHHIQIWDLQNGACIRSHSVGTGEHPWAVRFRRDGKMLATGGTDRIIRVWDVETGRLRRALPDQPDIVGKLAFSPDGKRIASLTMHEVKLDLNHTVFPWNNRIQIWDLDGGNKVRELRMDAKGNLYGRPPGFSALLFAPDGKRLATAGMDGFVRMWDVATGQQQWAFAMHQAAAVGLAFAADGRALAVGGPALRLIDAATGHEQRLPFGHVSGVISAAVAPDGRTIATGGQDHIQVWDATTGRPIRRLAGHGGDISVLRFARDGQSLVSAGVDKAVRLWDVRTGSQDRRIEVADAEPRPWAITPDGKAAAIAHRDGSISIADLGTGKELAHLPTAKVPVVGAVFAVDGRTLVVWQRDHNVRVWDWPAGKQLRHFAFWDPPDRFVPPSGDNRRDDPYAATVSPDGRFIAYCSQITILPMEVKRYLAIQEVATGKTLRVIELSLSDGVGVMAFSPDGRSLAWGRWQEPAIHFMELATGKERLCLDGHKGRVVSLAFAADGRTLVSGSDDTTALVWDVRRAQRARHLPLDREAAWRDLVSDDAAVAYAAMCRLAAAPQEAAGLLGERVKPVAAPAAKRVAKLIADLDSEQFDVRAAAQTNLDQLGETAADACRAALRTARSLESRRRLERLIDKQQAETGQPSGERLRWLRAVEVLEMAGTPACYAVLRRLANGAAGAQLTEEAKRGLRR